MSSYTTKQCGVCGNDYEHYASNRSGTCRNRSCRNIFYNRNARIPQDKHQPMYPLPVSEQKKRYTRLRNALDKCETREDRTAFYDVVMKEIYENGIWKWCMRKSPKTIRKNIDADGNPKIGRKSHTKTEYPNTKEMPE